MKNKKLFAILTLVCFMFTLMPVAAFAAPANVSNYAVKVEDADGELVEDVYVDLVTGGVSVTASAITAESTTLSAAAYYVLNANGDAVQIQYTTAGFVTFTFKAAGTYTIYAVNDATENGDLEELVRQANSLIESQTVADAVAKINAKLAADIIRTAAYVTVEAQEAVYAVYVAETTTVTTGTSVELDVKADSGFSADGNKQVTVKLVNNNVPVVGKVPTISAPDYVTVTPFNPKKVVTDAAGKITYNISANRAGDFQVVFGYEDAEEATVTVDAYDENIANVEVVKESANAINKAKGDTIKTGAVVKFTDANGAVIPTVGATSGSMIDGQVKVTVVSQPATSKLTAADVKLVSYAYVPGASELAIDSADKDLKVGSYKVKFALANGKSVTVGFEAAKMGDTVGIRFVQPVATIALNASVNTTAAAMNFPVQAYDAKGVVETLTYGEDYQLSAQGKALTTKGANVFVVSDDEKYIGSTITVLAKDNENKFVATTTVEVVDNGAEVVYVNKTAEVGVTTTLKANVLDTKGTKVVVPNEPKFVVLEKPANAYVYVDGEVDSTGKGIDVTFLGSVAGEYKIQTIVVDDNNEFVTGIETIVVGGNEVLFNDVVVVSIGANSMIVNDTVVALDVAPFIENSRTMLQFNVLNNFGIDVQWDEATRSVIAEGSGVKVVLTLDSKVATVNGVETTLDVAPYAVNGRTVVPVGFITGTFGIGNQIIAAADGSVADILFTK